MDPTTVVSIKLTLLHLLSLAGVVNECLLPLPLSSRIPCHVQEEPRRRQPSRANPGCGKVADTMKKKQALDSDSGQQFAKDSRIRRAV